MNPTEKLRHYAKPHPLRPGCWFFSTPRVAHTGEEALAIISYCEMLGVAVTDTITGQMLLLMADRLEFLEERVTRLEKK